MKTIRSFAVLFILIATVFAFQSCKKESGRSRLTVYLTDAPADYDQINIQVVDVQVKASSDAGENGWQSLPLASGPANFNLLEFTNGMDTLLSSVELPAGKISQLRLVLADNNTIVVNGVAEPLPLQVPSGSESGLKFNIHADLIEGIEYKLWIDFDAARSVVENGSGGYILKPVIRTFNEATSGAIKGIVSPIAAGATISATNGTDILSAIPDPVIGEFLLRGVPAGTWTVTIDANNGYVDQTINSVIVTTGQVSDVGSITLTQ